MPPPRTSSFFGASATMHSVVIFKPAIDAAFCKAVHVTLLGSRITIAYYVTVFTGRCVVAVVVFTGFHAI